MVHFSIYEITNILYGSHKHQLSHGSEYNMANIFRVSQIIPAYFTAKYENRLKYWVHCTRQSGDKWECHGTDQRCYVEAVCFLREVPSLLLQNEVPNLSNQSLYPVYTLEAARATASLVCFSLLKPRPSLTIIKHRPRSAQHRKPIYLWRQALMKGVTI